MEFAKPKELLNKVAEPALVKFLTKFYPALMPSVEEEKKDDGVPESITGDKSSLPHCHYTFNHRRIIAKIRKMGYYAVDAERLHRQLLHDELQANDMYDFKKFDEDNPAVTVVQEDEETKDTDKTDGPLVDVKDTSDKKEEEKKEEEKKEEEKKK